MSPGERLPAISAARSAARSFSVALTMSRIRSGFCTIAERTLILVRIPSSHSARLSGAGWIKSSALAHRCDGVSKRCFGRGDALPSMAAPRR